MFYPALQVFLTQVKSEDHCFQAMDLTSTSNCLPSLTLPQDHSGEVDSENYAFQLLLCRVGLRGSSGAKGIGQHTQ